MSIFCSIFAVELQFVCRFFVVFFEFRCKGTTIFSHFQIFCVKNAEKMHFLKKWHENLKN